MKWVSPQTDSRSFYSQCVPRPPHLQIHRAALLEYCSDGGRWYSEKCCSTVAIEGGGILRKGVKWCRIRSHSRGTLRRWYSQFKLRQDAPSCTYSLASPVAQKCIHGSISIVILFSKVGKLEHHSLDSSESECWHIWLQDGPYFRLLLLGWNCYSLQS